MRAGDASTYRRGSLGSSSMSIVLPRRHELELLRGSLPSCHSVGPALARATTLARLCILQGSLQPRSTKRVTLLRSDTRLHTGALLNIGTRDFWSRPVPMTFEDETKTYEEKRRFRYELQNYMHDVYKFNTFGGKKVLEIGVGAGIDSAEFLRNGAHVVGVDFSPLAVMSAKDLLKEANLDGHILLSDATHLPFKDSYFDVAYSFGVIHHIPNVSFVLEEIRRVLRQGGLFMGMVYNRDSLLYSYSILYSHGVKERLLAQGMSELEIASEFSERHTGNLYTKAYAKDEIASLLQEFFDEVWVGAYYNVIDTAEKRKVKFELETGKTDLGWHLTFKATKRRSES